MPETNPGQERLAALDLFKAHVPELRGHLQFIDFLIRAVMADMERFVQEADPGTQVFLKQLILMHLDHLESNSVPQSTTTEFVDAVRVWLTGDSQPATPVTSGSSQAPSFQHVAAETPSQSGGRI